MKKSDDISQAFLLKQFPGRTKLSSSIPAEVSRKNSVLVASTALLLAVFTSVILIRQTREGLQQEKAARQVLEQRLASMETEVARSKEISHSAALKTSEFARTVQEMALSSVKEEKVFFGRMIELMEKYQLNSPHQMETALQPTPMAQGLPPWEKAQ